MPTTFALNRTSRRVDLGNGKWLRAPGLTGSAIWRSPTEHKALLAGAPPDQMTRALAEAGLERESGFLSLEGITPSPTPRLAKAVPERSPHHKVLVGTTIASDEVEFAIYRDEDGILSLHLPIPLPAVGKAVTASVAARRGPHGKASVSAKRSAPLPPTHHYWIKLRTPQAAPAGTATPKQMAMLGGIGGRVIQFVKRKVLGGLAGDAVYLAAKAWEAHYRKPQGFHGGATATALLANPPAPVADLSSFKNKKTLLFIHGTSSNTSGAFAGLSQFSQAGNHLYENYENRVIGFNHHTLTKSVAQNAIDFYDGLPEGAYEFDVISHSRGGLLARALKELAPAQLAELADQPAWKAPSGVKVQIDKIMLVGTPDIGTPLADPNDLPKAVSRLASILSSFSQGVAEIGLGALLTIFGGIVEGGIGALPGLEDMDPGSPLLVELNTPPLNPAFYFGVEADYHPSGGLKQAIENNGVDALFLGELNDLIVPTLGVSTVKGQVLPPAQVDEYGQATGVYHLNYFYQAGTWDKILQCLA
jgi:pimeloyl-ACP methyl ester carboxylesterase